MNQITIATMEYWQPSWCIDKTIKHSGQQNQITDNVGQCIFYGLSFSGG